MARSVMQQRVAIYVQVSEDSHREDLERQAERLTQYRTTHGYQVTRVEKEIASGIDDSRPKLLCSKIAQSR